MITSVLIHFKIKYKVLTKIGWQMHHNINLQNIPYIK